MKRLLAGINLLLASFLPGATVSNKKQDPLPTTSENDTDEIINMQSVIEQAVEMAASARRIEEDMVYKSYGLTRPNSENRYVFTMNSDGTVDATAEKDPKGQKFIPVSDQDRKNYEQLKKSDSFNNIETIRDTEKVYKFKEKIDDNSRSNSE